MDHSTLAETDADDDDLDMEEAEAEESKTKQHDVMGFELLEERCTILSKWFLLTRFETRTE